MINPNDAPKYQFPIDFNEVVTSFETSLILAALEQTGGVICRAAILLKLRRTTLVEKVRKIRGKKYTKRNKDIRKSELWST